MRIIILALSALLSSSAFADQADCSISSPNSNNGFVLNQLGTKNVQHGKTSTDGGKEQTSSSKLKINQRFKFTSQHLTKMKFTDLMSGECVINATVTLTTTVTPAGGGAATTSTKTINYNDFNPDKYYTQTAADGNVTTYSYTYNYLNGDLFVATKHKPDNATKGTDYTIVKQDGTHYCLKMNFSNVILVHYKDARQGWQAQLHFYNSSKESVASYALKMEQNGSNYFYFFPNSTWEYVGLTSSGENKCLNTDDADASTSTGVSLFELNNNGRGQQFVMDHSGESGSTQKHY